VFEEKQYREIISVLSLLFGFLLLLSLITFDSRDFALLSANKPVTNLIGPLGAWISYLLRLSFGWASFFFPATLFFITRGLLRGKKLTAMSEQLLSLFLLAISFSALASFFNSSVFFAGGMVGSFLYLFLNQIIGKTGAFLVIAFFNIVSLILLGLISIREIMENSSRYFFGVNIIMEFFAKKRIKKMKKEIPLNNIEENLKKKKLPWITKEKVFFSEADIKNSKNFSNLPSIKNNNFENAMESYRLEYLSQKEKEIKKFLDQDNYENSAINNIEEDIFAEAPTSIETEKIFATEERSNGSYIIDSPEIIQDIPEENLNFIEDNTVSIKKNRIRTIEPSHTQKSISLKELPDENDYDISEEKIIEDREVKDLISDEYIIPLEIFDLSSPADPTNWQEEIKKNSQLLVKTLSDFNITSEVIKVNRGPVVTLYELRIASGIKVNKIVGLSDDIAMALAALRVRIVAPIPGKRAIGVEIPNKDREKVTLGDIINSKEYKGKKGLLKVALGKDILGHPVIIDLKKMPHLLIAGATGAGKSVCVNSIISSIIYHYSHDYVKFILVDPKMVELQLYNGMPHLLTPVITDPFNVPAAMKWLIYEMERRYKVLSEVGVRDIERYNEKIAFEGFEADKLPYIVTIIDELADLMMVASKEIEGYITRIAQKARAVGIHLVLATQRPSVDIITGIIKANFPARIAFQVAQKTDSRTIIDQNGAEKLLGKGDMLYLSPESSFPVRLQGAFVQEEETVKMVNHLKTIARPKYVEMESSLFENEDMNNGDDELFVDALKIIEETRKASASYLQRRLSIGYNRAARIIEQMEDMGYVGPQQGSKPREVLI